MYTNIKAVRKSIEELNRIDRENYGELSCYIGEEAVNECYDNDKSLHSLLNQYYNDEKALNLIDETLICVCGWGIESLIKHITQ